MFRPTVPGFYQNYIFYNNNQIQAPQPYVPISYNYGPGFLPTVYTAPPLIQQIHSTPQFLQQVPSVSQFVQQIPYTPQFMQQVPFAPQFVQQIPSVPFVPNTSPANFAEIVKTAQKSVGSVNSLPKPQIRKKSERSAGVPESNMPEPLTVPENGPKACPRIVTITITERGMSSEDYRYGSKDACGNSKNTTR